MNKFIRLLRTAFGIMLPLPAPLLLAILLAGCATTGGENPLPRLEVEVLDANLFNVEGRTVELGGLGRAVRRAGAVPATEIRLITREGTPPGSLVKAHGYLQAAGFLKVVQTPPRKATVEVVQPNLPPPPRPARKK